MVDSSDKATQEKRLSNEKEMENVVISSELTGQSTAPSTTTKRSTIDPPRAKKFSPEWWAVVRAGGEHRRRAHTEAERRRELGLPSDLEDEEEEEEAEEALERRNRVGESELEASMATYSRKRTKLTAASDDHAAASPMTMPPHAQYSTTHVPADQPHDKSPQGQVPNSLLPCPTMNIDSRESMNIKF